MDAVQVENISKSYGDVLALKNISFSAKEGEIFGIIGPDGAGKTTLFRILTTLILPDKGDAWVNGDEIQKQYREIRKKIGYMPGRFSLYVDMTVEENLKFFATLFNTSIEENYHLIKDIYHQIEPFKDRMAGKLSGGMKQKLALCCALIHKPTVLFLDEPTTGVDPISRKEFWDMLRKLKQQGITILVSTPYMDEASLCDRIAFIQNGKFLQIDTPERIKESYTEKLWAIRADSMHQLLKDLRLNPQIKSCFTFGESHHATVQPELTPERLNHFLEEKGHQHIEIETIAPSIEDCFMQLSINQEEKNE